MRGGLTHALNKVSQKLAVRRGKRARERVQKRRAVAIVDAQPTWTK